MRLLPGTVQPTAGAKTMSAQIVERLGAHVVIEGVEPFVGQATGTCVFGQGQLSCCRDVVSRNPRSASDAELQPEVSAQGNQALGALQDGHQITQSLVETTSGPVPFLWRDPAPDFDASEIKPA